MRVFITTFLILASLTTAQANKPLSIYHPIETGISQKSDALSVFGVKAGPILFDLKPVGGEVGIEFNLADFLSLCTFLKFNGGFELEKGGATIITESHFIIEPQLRFWPDDPMSGPFFSLLGKVYTAGHFGYGFIFGWQIVLESFTIEGFCGIQSRTPVEESFIPSPLFIRYGINIGFQAN